jgi:hypothetical protein
VSAATFFVANERCSYMEDLIARNDAVLVVFNCTHSLPENLKFQLFYNRFRMRREAKYIGFYKDKAVRAIGVLENKVFVNRTKKGLQIIGRGALTPDEEQRIEKSMDSAMANRKLRWDITHHQCFFLAGRVEETLFKKQNYAFRAIKKYFDLREVLELNAKEKLPRLSLLASALRGKTW